MEIVCEGEAQIKDAETGSCSSYFRDDCCGGWRRSGQRQEGVGAMHHPRTSKSGLVHCWTDQTRWRTIGARTSAKLAMTVETSGVLAVILTVAEATVCKIAAMCSIAYLHRGRLNRLFGSSPSASVFRYFFPLRVAMTTQTELPFTLVQKRQVPSSIPLIAASSLMHQGPSLLEPVAPPMLSIRRSESAPSGIMQVI